MTVEQAFVTWFLVVAGWLFVSWNNDRRARRIEIRSLVNEAIALTQEMERCAHAYWMKKGDESNSQHLGVEIIRGLNRLARIINTLKRHNDAFGVDDKMKIFRQSITLGDFDSKTRLAVFAGDKRISDITEAAFDLTEEIEKRFEQIYCSSWFRIFR